MTLSHDKTIPARLRTWFIVHFILGFIIALPLLLVAEILLPLIGWQPIDPIMSRIVGAALMGIGVESLLSRNTDYHAYKAMLNLKIIWASSTSLGIALGLVMGGVQVSLVFLAIFIVFLGVWIYYRLRIG